ncbi:hypothetical protein ACFO3J_21060 [Streptomyces polygonati]|uniref:ADP ribosyltransferase domain-containing protein n=1 Tax=Streptomyces polygonati TaxID=1617087 RepID=A0ABV8HQL5_9ACTN
MTLWARGRPRSGGGKGPRGRAGHPAEAEAQAQAVPVLVEDHDGLILLRAPLDDALGPADVVDLTRGLRSRGGMVTLIVGAQAAAADALWPRLNELLDSLRDTGTTAVRLALAGAAEDHPDQPAVARRIADGWDITVEAPVGAVLAVPGGSLFAPEGGWWRFAPGEKPVALGPRCPAPSWQAALGRLPARTSGGCVVGHIPAGLIVRPAEATAPEPGDLYHAVPVDPKLPAVVVGVAYGEDVSAEEVAALLAHLLAGPASPTASVRLIPGGLQDLLPMAQRVAGILGGEVEVTTGLPLFAASGPLASYAARSVLIGADGSPGWLPFVDAVVCRPSRPGAPAPAPRLLRWSPPLPGPGRPEEGVVRLSDRWQVTATRAGLWVDTPERAHPPHTARPVAAGGPAIEVGTRGEQLDSTLWPDLSRLLGALSADLRERATVYVHGTLLDGGRELRRLAVQHGLRTIRYATTSAGPGSGPRRPVPPPGPPRAPAPGPLSAPVPGPRPRAAVPPVDPSATPDAGAGPSGAPAAPGPAPDSARAPGPGREPMVGGPPTAAGPVTPAPAPGPRPPAVVPPARPSAVPRPASAAPDAGAGPARAPVESGPAADSAPVPGPGREPVAAPVPSAPVVGRRPPLGAPPARPAAPMDAGAGPSRASVAPGPAADLAHRPAPGPVPPATDPKRPPVPASGIGAGRPLRPSQRSTDEERAAFRALAEPVWNRHAGVVAQALAVMPDLTAEEREAARADLIALRAYLDDAVGPLGHRELTRALRGGDDRLLPYAACLASGLRRMPTYRGLLLRGTGAEDGRMEDLLPCAGLSDRAPVSAVLSGGGTALPPGARYALWSVTGRRVRHLSDGRDHPDEVVFPAGTPFRVLDVRPGGASPLVLLRELPTPDTRAAAAAGQEAPAGLDDADRAVLARLEDALRGRPHPAGKGGWPPRCAGPIGDGP